MTHLSLTLVENNPVLPPQEKPCCMAEQGNGTLALTNMNCLLIHFVRNFAQPISTDPLAPSHRSAICASASSWPPPRLCRRPVPTGAGPADGGADVDAATGGEGAAVLWRECLPWRPSHDWRRQRR